MQWFIVFGLFPSSFQLCDCTNCYSEIAPWLMTAFCSKILGVLLLHKYVCNCINMCPTRTHTNCTHIPIIFAQKARQFLWKWKFLLTLMFSKHKNLLPIVKTFYDKAWKSMQYFISKIFRTHFLIPNENSFIDERFAVYITQITS